MRPGSGYPGFGHERGPEHPAAPDEPAATSDEPATVTGDELPGDTPPAAEAPLQPPQLGGAEYVAEDVDDAGGYVSVRPLLMVGAGGPDVQLLCDLLAEHGYENPVASGKEEPVLTDEIMLRVRLFQDENGINPAGAQDGAPPLISKQHSGVVDALTWDALGARLEHSSRADYYLAKAIA